MLPIKPEKMGIDWIIRYIYIQNSELRSVSKIICTYQNFFSCLLIFSQLYVIAGKTILSHYIPYVIVLIEHIFYNFESTTFHIDFKTTKNIFGEVYNFVVTYRNCIRL